MPNSGSNESVRFYGKLRIISDEKGRARSHSYEVPGVDFI